MLRIKKEHIGKRLVKGNEFIELTNNLTDKQILYVKNMISADYVEEVIEKNTVEVKEPETSLEKAEREVKSYTKKSRKNK
jgi:hypothetical protein